MKKSDYKLLIVDIDGTLLGEDRTISVEDREALAKVGEQGIQVCLSTGRATIACLSIIERLSLDGYHIFFDGALVTNLETGEEVYAQPISPEIVKQAIDFSHSNDINLELYSATHYLVERETSWVAYRRFFGIEPTVVDFSEVWKRERIVKGGLLVESPQEAERVEYFQRHFEGRLQLSWARTPAFPGVDFINVIAPEVSKGKALEALASYLGVPLAQVIAIGDGTNDIPVLSVAGLGIAMDNAPDEVKAVADYVTLHIDHSGVAAAINKFLL